MEFGWSREQREIHASMRELGLQTDRAPVDDRLSKLAAGGALGLSLPTEFGGGGLDHVTTAFAYEGLGATLRDAGVLLAAGAHLFGVASMLARVGTPDQKKAWLPRLATGSAIATVAATERESGSDVSKTATIATAHGDRFRIRGSKRFVTAAQRASVFFVLAKHAPESETGPNGISAWLVPSDAPGLRIGPPLATAGLRGAGLCPIELVDCEVGPEALLGRAGAGLSVFQLAMTFERALILAFRLGAMQDSLDEAVRFAKEREVGGVRIAKHQAVAHRIARMKLRLESSRYLVYRAAWLLDRGDRAHAEAALAKWQLADAAVASALDDLQLRGGAGYLEESGLPLVLDDSLGGTLHSGTADVLATIVARWLGL